MSLLRKKHTTTWREVPAIPNRAALNQPAPLSSQKTAAAPASWGQIGRAQKNHPAEPSTSCQPTHKLIR